MAGIPYTQEEEILLRQKCGTNISFKEMEEFFPNRTAFGLQIKARAMGLSNYFQRRKYNSNKEFWDNFNPVSCYWAGFAAADGNLIDYNGYNVFSIQLHSSDREHLDLFLKNTSSSNPIKDCIRKNKKLGGNPHFHSKISICEKAWLKGLTENFNIKPRKTWDFEPPKLEGELLACWIAGFIDGDGCYHFSKLGNFGISASLATEKALQLILDFSEKFPSMTRKTRKVGKVHSYFRLGINGLRAIHMAHYLMSLPCPHMRRKYDYVRNYLLANPQYNLSLPPYEESLAKITPQS
ncbi:MAG: hypothetical protein FMNOHCHN_03958 [Ignavibacteriaceae bacterium]|nr:hypothetical protein [Ignavibacteriaceae bacterium]